MKAGIADRGRGLEEIVALVDSATVDNINDVP